MKLSLKLSLSLSLFLLLPRANAQMLPDHFEGEAILTYGSSTAAGAFANDDMHGGLAPALGLAHLYRFTFYPEAFIWWLPIGTFQYPSNFVNLNNGQILYNIGPMSFRLNPSSPLVRAVFKTISAGSAQTYTTQIVRDTDSYVITMWVY